MSDIQRLRDEARKAHRAAGNKASRLRTVKGVEVSGTKYDVRRDPAKIKRYNKAQLESYIADLKGFTNRRNNYVAGSAGTPIPATLWNQYQQAERRFNSTGAEKFSKVADIFLPGLGRTIGERTADLNPKARRADGEIANRPYSELHKKPSSIPSVEALLKSMKYMDKKNAPDYNTVKLRVLRENALKMIEPIGDKEMTHRIKSMSDNDFDFLWNYTQFAKEALPKYLKAMVDSKHMKRDDLIDAMTAEGNSETLYDLLNLAELPADERKDYYKPRPQTRKRNGKPNDPRAVGKLKR